MGTKSTLFCPVCHYETLTSAGPDRGFLFYTNTYVCTTCKTLQDMEVTPSTWTEVEPTTPERFVRIKAGTLIKGQHCPGCHGTTFKRWNKRKRPCPVCGHKMERGEGIVEMFD